jgi:DNA (cytosine-5)-methyltransferase 1
MDPDLPAPTITTNTSHIGGDYKIHPWENRVLTALECADLQTVPRWFDWSSALKATRPRRAQRVSSKRLLGAKQLTLSG